MRASIEPSFRMCQPLLVTAALLVAAVASTAAGAGNYLIIVAEEFDGTAPMTQFINAKVAQGFVVNTHVVAPGTSTSEIKDYIHSLWGTLDAPQYILLVGDTPAVPHWTGGGSKQAPTDLPYACMGPGDDWYPDIAIGRFSVSSVSELQAIVDKTLFVEAGDFPDPDYVKRGAFLANPSTVGMAEPTHDWVIENYFDPNGYEGIRLYSSEGAGTQDVADAVNLGCLWVGYYGHSGSSGWWDPSFVQSDVHALSNEGLYGVAWSFSCNVGNFTIGECFGETWLREAGKGAAGVIFPSGYIYWGSQEAWQPSTVLEHSFFRAFFEDDIWEVGPAWQAGLYHFLTDFDGSEDIKRNFLELYNLLGDPSLRLPQPYGFALSVDPASQDICCPPDDQAMYSIDVESLGGFQEPVTLAASGEPTGATVEFDIALSRPPFTAVMTVNNLTGAAAGQYNIVIEGTSTSAQRSKSVGLNISSDIPEDVTLVSPPSGATDVSRSPTLSWQASSGALTYELEVATDPGFSSVVYGATTPDTDHLVAVFLDALTSYYWHVRAVNACGNSGFSPAFSFTTLEQTDYFTEQFSGDFDLDNFTLGLIADGSGSFYSSCAAEALDLPTDPSGGNVLSLSDDGYTSVSPSQPVWLYGASYSSFYVNANGNITFTSGDGTVTESLSTHFNAPRVSGLFDDLNPASAGTVSWKELSDRVAVTWQDVPEYGTSNSNTFQIELFHNGNIRITWLGIDSGDSIVGPSRGDGIPDDYLEYDVSAVGWCAGDVDNDADVDLDDWTAASECLAGPDEADPPVGCDQTCFDNADLTGDNDVDVEDFAIFQDVSVGG